MTKNSGSGSSSSGSSGSGTGSGTGGLKSAFFRAVQANMEKRGWRSVDVPGFGWAAVETEHFDLDSQFAMFDADAAENLEGAHRRLSRWADEQGGAGIPQTRVAVAVFDNASRKDVDYITRGLLRGASMNDGDAAKVIDGESGVLGDLRRTLGAG